MWDDLANHGAAIMFMVAMLTAAGVGGKWVLKRLDKFLDWIQGDTGPVERFINSNDAAMKAISAAVERHDVAAHRQWTNACDGIEAIRMAGVEACNVVAIACKHAGINGDLAAGIQRVQDALRKPTA